MLPPSECRNGSAWCSSRASCGVITSRWAAADHVEFGAIHRPRDNANKALVDVYFISRQGEATGWTYSLAFEDGDWKIDGAEQIPGWPAGQRLSGLKV